MTIKKTLLVAFLGLGLGASILLTALAFVKARSTLRAEIDRTVLTGADALGAGIDRMLFERLQNAAIWSRLDIMQDIQIRDIDKRLSRFLADLKRGYGDVYVALSCTDRSGQIVASSDAALVGTTPPVATPWLQATFSGAPLSVSLDRTDKIGVLIEVPVPSATDSGALGVLRLRLDWTDIENLLDRAVGESGRMAILLDARGQAIGASKSLRGRAPVTLDAVAPWRFPANRVSQRNGAPLVDGDVIVGSARLSNDAGSPDRDWTVLIVQPVAQALAPVQRMALMFLFLLSVIALLTVAIALWVSHAIARPIVALTSLAREYVRTRVLQAPASGGVGEVAELSNAFVRMVRDIDLSQKKLIRASKLAVVGEMSSVIAHEVRTPLGIIRSSAQVLGREPGIGAEGRELAGFIESETERLNRLVSAMLDSARPRTPIYTTLDMHELLKRAAGLLGAQLADRGISVSLDLRAANPSVECDEEQMTQVILNIMMNALQVLDRGGRIELRTRDSGDSLAIDIADNGPGIAPQERAQVFDAFFFKREGGVGLGLAIVQQIVQTHGGSIEVAESEQAGALFQIRMPHRRSEAP
ncbi:MAG TPA: ATP-binding protein [Rhodanobacteraceae bacterium]